MLSPTVLLCPSPTPRFKTFSVFLNLQLILFHPHIHQCSSLGVFSCDFPTTITLQYLDLQNSIDQQCLWAERETTASMGPQQSVMTLKQNHASELWQAGTQIRQ